MVSNGGFEAGTPAPFWMEYSENFGTPLCGSETCATEFTSPRTGFWWAWFGGYEGYEFGSLTQNVTIPLGSAATLNFYLWISQSDGDSADYLKVMLDGVQLFSVLKGNPVYTGGYTQVSLDLSSKADGLAHSLGFISATYGPGITNFLVDDVSLIACNGTFLPPTVVTGEATEISLDGASTDVLFEYGTTADYDSSAPAGQSPVTGNSQRSVSATITNLLPDTTYHYRITASSSGGTSDGEDRTFTTRGVPAAPVVTTQPAIGITHLGATLKGLVNAQNADTTVTFEYGTSVGYGHSRQLTSPVTGDTDVPVGVYITGLQPDTTYHYRIRGDNSVGTSYGEDMTFSTFSSCIERVADGSFEAGSPNPSWIENSTSPFRDTPLCSQETCGWSPNLGVWWAWFGGGYDPESGSLGENVMIPSGGSSVMTFYLWIPESGGDNADVLEVKVDGSGVFSVNGGNLLSASDYALGYTEVSVDLSAFSDGEDHYISFESSTTADGVTSFLLDDVSILACGFLPSVTTGLASSVSWTEATLNGIVNPVGETTVAFFEYGTTDKYGSSIAVSQGVLGGDTDVAVTADLTGLIPNTIYHFRVKGVNTTGAAKGGDSVFNTMSCGPVRLDATDYASMGAAYLAVTADNSEIALVTGEYAGNLLLDSDYSVIFEGGNDCSFGPPAVYSTIRGNVTIENGTATLDRIIISDILVP